MWCKAEYPMISRAGEAPRHPARGFTLIELLVVIVIIAVLAGVVAPAVLRNVGDAKTGTAKSQVELLSLALNQYRLDNDGYPTTEQGLTVLRTAPTGDAARTWRGPYLQRVVPIDPWGRPYVYVSPGRSEQAASFELYTLGRDGQPGGTGEDADVTSWGGPVEGAGTVESSAAVATP